MKKIFSLILVVVTVFIGSCKKDVKDGIRNVEINATVSSGEEYRLDLEQYSEEKSIVKITKQATNYTVSEINAGSGTLLYRYTTAAKASGTDHVIISLLENEDERCRKDGATMITVNFTIR